MFGLFFCRYKKDYPGIILCDLYILKYFIEFFVIITENQLKKKTNY
jgi:hypothetical protein